MTSEEKTKQSALRNQSPFYLNEDNADIQIWNDGIYDATVEEITPVFMEHEGQQYPHAMTITLHVHTPTGAFLAEFQVTCRLIWSKGSACRKLVRTLLDRELTATESVGVLNSYELLGKRCKVRLARYKWPSYGRRRPYSLREVLPISDGSYVKEKGGRYAYVPAAQASLARN